jgi:hypothetical protein
MLGAIFTLLNAGQEIMVLMPLLVLILSIIVFIRNRTVLIQKCIAERE